MSEADPDAALRAFRSARDRYHSLEADIEAIGTETLERQAEALRTADRLLDSYADRATGSGDFGSYITFRSSINDLVDDLPEDLPDYDAFETFREPLDKRRLSTADFETAREALEPARTTVSIRADRDDARDDFRAARQDLREVRDALEDRINTLERAQELGAVDLSAPIEDLRDPIETYNQSVQTAYDDWLDRTPASSVLALHSLAEQYPLVDLPPPPDDLVSYVTDVVPELTVHDLLSYAEYSTSKLSHYVDAPQRYKAEVATERTYLSRLDGTPLTVSWPPSPADELWWRLRELLAIVDRFAPPAVIEDLRDVRAIVRDRDRYAELREVALANTELDEDLKARLADGTLVDELETVRRDHDRIVDELRSSPAT